MSTKKLSVHTHTTYNKYHVTGGEINGKGFPFFFQDSNYTTE